MTADALVLGSALVSGLMGSAHCAAMCGGIATGFAVPGAPGGWRHALEPNVGRLAGYVLAGAIAGGFGHGIVALAATRPLQQGLRAAVGLVLVVVALRLLDRSGRAGFATLPGTALARLLAPLWRRARTGGNGSGWRRVLVGVAWGWLPCGLSTTVLAAAWLQADAGHGALTMLAFGAGTLPVMLPLTWSGARLGQSLQRGGWRIAAGVVVMLAGLVTLAGPWLERFPGMHGVLAALGCRSVAG